MAYPRVTVAIAAEQQITYVLDNHGLPGKTSFYHSGERESDIANNPDPQFAANAMNASLTLLSILVAVITVVAVQYKNVQSDAALAGPVYQCLIGATGAATLAGLIAFLSLLHVRGNPVHVNLLVWLFGILIIGMVLDIIWTVYVLAA
jgi:hypothetical protein